jgi:sarcosine oxidase
LERCGERLDRVERFARGHHEGASHGETRNYTTRTPRRTTSICSLAREGWDALGDVDGEPLPVAGTASYRTGLGVALGAAPADAAWPRRRRGWGSGRAHGIAARLAEARHPH